MDTLSLVLSLPDHADDRLQIALDARGYENRQKCTGKRLFYRFYAPSQAGSLTRCYRW